MKNITIRPASLDLVENLLRLIITEAEEFPVGEGSDEAEAERDTLNLIRQEAERALLEFRSLLRGQRKEIE